jgi:REP element-mobilizing transposase RayT
MPRRARIMLPGVAVHVIQRANNRAACFAADEDRAFYLFHLGRMLMRTACNLHAYCLMGNHVHLLLTPENMAACSHLMKGIGQLYSQYVNKLYKKSGHLWEGRFKSCLVQSEQYVLACYRYIELNPVRAEIRSGRINTGGPVTVPTRSEPTPSSLRRTRSTFGWVARPKNGRRPIATSSGWFRGMIWSAFVPRRTGATCWETGLSGQ